MVVLAQWFSIFCFCCFCSEKCFTLLKFTEDPQRVFLYRLYLLVFSVFDSEIVHMKILRFLRKYFLIYWQDRPIMC